MIENLHWLGHASFYARSKKGTIVYFDPYQLGDGLPKADLILITHDHFDHCSAADIAKISKRETVVVGPAAVAAKLSGGVRIIAAGGRLTLGDVAVEAVAAYNLDKSFHPRSAGYLGLVAVIDGVRIYHAGDTDLIPEMKSVRADVALLPVGGTYTMTAAEAASAVAMIKPKIAVPMHYGAVAGSPTDAQEFGRLCRAQARILEAEGKGASLRADY